MGQATISESKLAALRKLIEQERSKRKERVEKVIKEIDKKLRTGPKRDYER